MTKEAYFKSEWCQPRYKPSHLSHAEWWRHLNSTWRNFMDKNRTILKSVIPNGALLHLLQ